MQHDCRRPELVELAAVHSVEFGPEREQLAEEKWMVEVRDMSGLPFLGVEGEGSRREGG